MHDLLDLSAWQRIWRMNSKKENLADMENTECKPCRHGIHGMVNKVNCLRQSIFPKSQCSALATLGPFLKLHDVPSVCQAAEYISLELVNPSTDMQKTSG